MVAPRPRARHGQLLKEVRKRLFYARRILDFYARNFQSQNRKTHGHAMVIVGLDLGAVEFGWIDFEMSPVSITFAPHLVSSVRSATTRSHS